MKTLNSLIRLHRGLLDERRRELAALEERHDEIEAAKARLAEEVKREQRLAAADFEAWLGYGNFARAAMRRREALNATLAELEAEIAEASNRVAEAFQELKRYDIAAENRRKRLRLEAARREQAVLDDIGLTMYRRREET